MVKQDTIYVVVRVEGGNIQYIESSDPSVRVCVIDEDNIERGDERPDERDIRAYDFPVGRIPRPANAPTKLDDMLDDHSNAG